MTGIEVLGHGIKFQLLAIPDQVGRPILPQYIAMRVVEHLLRPRRKPSSASWSKQKVVFKRTLIRPRRIKHRDRRPSGVMRKSENSNLPFHLLSKTMPTREPEPSSNRPVTEPLRPRGGSSPVTRESSIEYIGRKEPRVPVPILLLGSVALAAAIVAFLHFSRP